MQDLQARRVVTRHPECVDSERWHGTVVSPATPPLTKWRGGSIEAVVDAMNQSLSPIPDHRYEIVEAG